MKNLLIIGCVFVILFGLGGLWWLFHAPDVNDAIALLDKCVKEENSVYIEYARKNNLNEYWQFEVKSVDGIQETDYGNYMLQYELSGVYYIDGNKTSKNAGKANLTYWVIQYNRYKLKWEAFYQG